MPEAIQDKRVLPIAVRAAIESKIREEVARQGSILAKTLIESLTPSASTKADYIGEFSFEIEVLDDDGNETSKKVYVPWTTTKEIMAAILKRADKKFKEIQA